MPEPITVPLLGKNIVSVRVFSGTADSNGFITYRELGELGAPNFGQDSITQSPKKRSARNFNRRISKRPGDTRRWGTFGVI